MPYDYAREYDDARQDDTSREDAEEQTFYDRLQEQKESEPDENGEGIETCQQCGETLEGPHTCPEA